MPEKIVHITSSERDLSVHPSASRYTVPLPGDDRYKRTICGIELIGATFPKTQPIFTDDNRFIDIGSASSSVTYSLEIPVGNYGVADILNYLNQKYESLVYCRVIVATGTFVIGGASSDNPIRLLPATGPNKHRSAHTTLGFPTVDTEFAQEHFGVMHMNLDSSSYVDVIVEEIPSAAHQETPIGPTLARVPLDNSNFTIKYWENDYKGVNYFYPMFLPKITIQLRNANGKLYDTFGFDHGFTFLVRYHSDAYVPPQDSLPPPPVPPAAAITTEETPPPKNVIRNVAIGMGVLGTSYFAFRRMGPSGLHTGV